MLYTQECCLYPMLNGILRDHTQPEHLTAFLPYLKLLLTGLNKLPLKRVKVFRGVKLDLHEQYNQLQGRVFRWWAFSSTSVKETTADAFTGGGESTMFIIDAVGVDISPFSRFPNEQEVLLLPGTGFVVEQSVQTGPKYWTFELSVSQAAESEQQPPPKPHQPPGEQKIQNGEEQQRPPSVVDVVDDDGGPVCQFQLVDLAHPGWEVHDVLLKAPRNKVEICDRCTTITSSGDRICV